MGKNTRLQSTLLWVAAIVITLSSVIYQRKTGPTYAVSGELTSGSVQLHYELPRSEDSGVEAEIILTGDIEDVQATLQWRRFRSHDDWTATRMRVQDKGLVARLPTLPAAGKMMYSIVIQLPDGSTHSLTAEPVVLRYKGAVPAFILLPHILFMFISMLLSTRTGLAAWVDSPATMRYAWVTAVLLFLGGLILGPIVQKYAFDAFWTGWPFGHDLTDNKTLVAMIAWVLAIWRQWKKGSARGWFIAAALIQLLIYLIPHSVLGSELDFTEME